MLELVDWVVERQIPGAFAFDSYFTNAAVCNHIAQHARAYVGDLKFNRKVWFRGDELRADEMAAQIPAGSPQEGDHRRRTQWYFTKTIWLPEYTHAVRVVILWNQWNGKDPVKILITNQPHWDVTRVLRGYGHRWTGTETLHRDGKQHFWAWATVNCAAAKARRGISTSCCWCTVCSWLNCARAVRVRGPPRR